MPDWNQSNLHKHMPVYSADNHSMGHIAEIYADTFLIRKGLIFQQDRYIPYNDITSVEKDRVHLRISPDEAQNMEHLGDPTQLMYDRGHGRHDIFEETNPGH